MGVLHMPTAAGHHPLKSCPRHEATPQIILKSVTFTMTTDSPSRAPPPPVGPRDPTPLARVPGHITPNREGRSSLYSLARVRRNLYLTTREGSRCKRAREEWM